MTQQPEMDTIADRLERGDQLDINLLDADDLRAAREALVAKRRDLVAQYRQYLKAPVVERATRLDHRNALALLDEMIVTLTSRLDYP